VEVGLGGRLDATNVFDEPLCTAITSIGRDHTRYLGDELDSIAAEKAAIARAGVPVVCGRVDETAWSGIERELEHHGETSVWRVGEELQQGGGSLWSVANRDGQRVEARLSLAGRHQQDNAAVATGIAWRLAEHFDGIDASIAKGLENVDWPGRFERLEIDGVPLVLDCAHNVEAVEALCATLSARQSPSPGDDPGSTLVFGTMGDKPWQAMLERLAPRFERRVYCAPLTDFPSRPPRPPEEFVGRHAGEIAHTPQDALLRALERRPPLVLVTGSAYLVGAARAHLLNLPSDTVVPL
jgi:dihydrofolate synthase/folylpolyglutamate synthase